MNSQKRKVCESVRKCVFAQFIKCAACVLLNTRTVYTYFCTVKVCKAKFAHFWTV
jgi:hypothetical protein